MTPEPEPEPERYSRPNSTWTTEDRAAHAAIHAEHSAEVAAQLAVKWEAEYGVSMAALCERTGLSLTEALLFWLTTKYDHTHRQTDALIAAWNRMADASAAVSKRQLRYFDRVEEEAANDAPWKESGE